jgi:transcription-repair coupling factor (superfamily II helicase)
LDKLGGVSFAKTKAAVKKAAREMAGALLDLYAKRSAWNRAALTVEEEMQAAFDATFPFEETDDQARTIDEVMADLDSDRSMDRLVCGDVGFGKTEVAMRAAFRAVMAGKQVAVLVPTTVLAQQHYQSFLQRFSAYPVNVEMLSRFRTQTQNRDTVLRLKTGLVDIVIGTHRLLSKDVHFKQLGLLIIDEEHRFGVAHKERVRSLRTTVDTLTLTATPIPRTLQMAMGGVRDLSLISTPPSARKPVRTLLCHDDSKTLSTAIERELAREGQVFFVHNRVKDIGKVAERVQELAPKARIAIGHGQMKEDDLERTMFDFVSGRYDILVCTTIIESGLDIPRANTIIIDRADTYGLAQLYQLRGRVGRSHQQAYAYLIVPPVSQLSDDARTRVETLVRHTELGSGFSVATMDLEIRGSGDILGADQSGNVSAVGLEMFCDLLSEAVAELQGEPRQEDIEPELTFDSPGLIPEDYAPDVGERLQWYKRLASASSETHVQHIAGQLVDRHGPLPKETDELVKAMVAKSLCRSLRIRGLEVGNRGLVVHLTPDCKVRPAAVLELIRRSPGRVHLSPDMKIRVKLPREEQDSADAAIRFLHELASYDRNSLES